MIFDLLNVRQTSGFAKFFEFFHWQTINPQPNTFYFVRRIPYLGSIIKIEKINVKNIRLAEIEKIARETRALFVKIEPFADLSKQEELDKIFYPYGYTHDSWPLTATATIIIDLKKSPDVILANFKNKFRYNLRLAKNKNKLKVQIIDGKELAKNVTLLKQFTELFNQRAKQIKSETHSFEELLHTCKAHGENLVLLYVMYPKQNYQKLDVGSLKLDKDVRNWKLENKNLISNVQLLDPTSNSQHLTSEMIAAALFLFTPDICHYWHNGSTPEGRSLFAPTVIIAEGIRLAKEKGCKIFDFEGIYDERFPDQTRRWKGFTRFKTGFGGEKVTFVRPYIKYYSPVFKFFNLLKMI